ncbi:Fanconi anemia group D2 protein isoform X1 [Larimichthys crocea]|uniref:Fanconi anemia group D2 protein isoform X1 n=1 Tax=Larimichthys crocea TaxID=215358 RepID=UPI000F5D7DF4|nr:Fanconi anemia group D2 protein isoform X1 [Larimichthys crocea]XP_027135660.1 Fanconi anemia group D2 protein isoform X1 [Larimichthys crocea]XP_027135661.1 Fanconi anemia group D2 protein isoform X1 [Larimichthys crocea]
MMRKKRRSSVDKGEEAATATKSKKSRSAGRQPKEAPSEETNQSVFGVFLREAGVTLKQGGTSNEIAVDQVVFQKRIQKQLKKSPRYPGIVQEFTAGLESHIEDPERFRNCLLPCVPRLSDGDSSCVSSFQESLLRMLLGIEMLQTFIINILLEKLPEYMLDGPADGGLSIPRIIINQLKWLDRVVDSKELATKLMELVSVAPVEVQRDIITSLPEMLDDSQHNDIARELNTLLQENTQLTVPILDALSSLNLSSSLLTEVRGAVMATLAAVQLEDLPVVVKFILHAVSASDAYEVVYNLRKKLELEQCVLLPALQASQSRIKKKGSVVSASTPAAGSSQDSVTLILDGIKSAVRFQKTISEAWLKAIESVDEVEDHKVIDLLVLFILHSTNANQSRRGAERVLKIKVRTGLIQDALLQRTFRDYAQVMRGYFPSILALAQTLLRSPDPCVVPFGGHMYRHAFTAFDSYCQQEVVSSLVTHVCSGVGGEVDMALELLSGLVTEKPSEMSLYAVFVKGILDYMDNLTPQQIRRLFHLLSRLAFGQQQQGSHIQDDMHIVIRKQLSSTVPKYKRIGIIGAVMIVGSMGAFRLKVKESQNGSLPQETFRQVTALLELVKSSSESSPEAAALYYDELANLILISNLDPQVQETIADSVVRDFQDDFVVDVGPEISGSFPFPACVMYNLDEKESQENIAINLLPVLAKDMQNKGEQQSQTKKAHRRVSPLCLSPFFRLLRLCEEKQNEGGLEEIDGLLGCPVILTDMDVVEKMESLSKAEKEFLCTLLFHTINWFREIINAFCRQKETEMKMKVMTRLQNITYLQTLLERALAETPGYVPPVANFDGESTDGTMLSTSAPVNKAKKEGTGKKRKAPAKNSSESSSQLDESTEADKTQQEQPEKEKEKEIRQGVSLVSYRQFFRELDIEVLSVLQCDLISRSLLDSELNTKAVEEVVLGPAELVFLLEDMFRKLEFSLTAAPAKRSPFLKGRTDKSVGFSHLQQKSSKDIASCCVELLPALCSHLENCHNHFQTLLSENNGVVDGPATDVQEHQLMSSAYQLLLQVLNTAFSWSGFSQPGQRNLLKKALGVMAGRLKEGGAELTLEQLVKHSFEYLVNFRSTMPNLSTALCLSQLLSTVSEKGGNPAAYREQTASLAKRFLSQEWVTASGEKERGNKFNEALHTLLSIYLEHVDDVLKAVEEIAGEGIPELLNASKDESSASWPTLSRQTFLVFYKVLLAELEKAARKIPASKNSDSTEVSHQAQSEKLLTWNLAVRDFHILVNLVKVFDSRPVLSVCLKYGRHFLESFLKLGMPLLDNSFKRHKEDVQSLLKTFQLSTRQLHHLCGHSKIHQDMSLTNHVPALKKSLELFVYRVKAMLTLNNCQEAFWIGNLKNRNLKGEEILSQRSQESEDDGEEEEEEERRSPQPEEESEDEAQETDRGESKKGAKEDEVEEDISDDSD